MLDLAVVIVTWNIKSLIGEALQSLIDDLAQTSLTYEIVVVDSASSDGTPDFVHDNFPNVTLIAHDENVGFGRSNNLGLEHLGFGQDNAMDLPRVVYLLNPDTITKQGATQTLFDALFASENVGLVGAKLSYGDGSFQHSAFTFPDLKQLWVEFFPTPGRFIEGTFNGRYPRDLYEQSNPFPVDFMLGATMMLKSEVIQQTGMFDPIYFMYAEEVDWAWRIRQAGWQILCVPTAHVVHLSGQSSSQVRPFATEQLWKSRLILFKRIFSKWKFVLAQHMIRIGIQRKMHDLETQDIESSQHQAMQQTYESIIKMTHSRNE